MELSELTIRLLLLFFPGIICHLIVDALTVHRTRRLDHIILHSFVYGVVCYLVYAVCYSLCHIRIENGILIPSPDGVAFLRTLTDEHTPVSIAEVLVVSALSFLVAFLLSYAINHHWIYHIAKKLRVTRRFGQPNVWLFALESKEVRWATVRDIKNCVMFQGYVRAYSDIEPEREILLTQVIAYNEKTAQKLYEADVMYLARKRDDITIEFPVLQESA
ncbi:MAG: hypothetical protein J0M17_17840 [Planctomycetes bacterium]|nr:hypothetical protein [Planctomycetota bacterium]